MHSHAEELEFYELADKDGDGGVGIDIAVDETVGSIIRELWHGEYFVKFLVWSPAKTMMKLSPCHNSLFNCIFNVLFISKNVLCMQSCKTSLRATNSPAHVCNGNVMVHRTA